MRILGEVGKVIGPSAPFGAPYFEKSLEPSVSRGQVLDFHKSRSGPPTAICVARDVASGVRDGLLLAGGASERPADPEQLFMLFDQSQMDSFYQFQDGSHVFLATADARAKAAGHRPASSVLAFLEPMDPAGRHEFSSDDRFVTALAAPALAPAGLSRPKPVALSRQFPNASFPETMYPLVGSFDKDVLSSGAKQHSSSLSEANVPPMVSHAERPSAFWILNCKPGFRAFVVQLKEPLPPDVLARCNNLLVKKTADEFPQDADIEFLDSPANYTGEWVLVMPLLFLGAGHGLFGGLPFRLGNGDNDDILPDKFAEVMDSHYNCPYAKKWFCHPSLLAWVELVTRLADDLVLPFVTGDKLAPVLSMLKDDDNATGAFRDPAWHYGIRMNFFIIRSIGSDEDVDNWKRWAALVPAEVWSTIDAGPISYGLMDPLFHPLLPIMLPISNIQEATSIGSPVFDPVKALPLIRSMLSPFAQDYAGVSKVVRLNTAWLSNPTNLESIPTVWKSYDEMHRALTGQLAGESAPDDFGDPDYTNPRSPKKTKFGTNTVHGGGGRRGDGGPFGATPGANDTSTFRNPGGGYSNAGGPFGGNPGDSRSNPIGIDQDGDSPAASSKNGPAPSPATRKLTQEVAQLKSLITSLTRGGTLQQEHGGTPTNRQLFPSQGQPAWSSSRQPLFPARAPTFPLASPFSAPRLATGGVTVTPRDPVAAETAGIFANYTNPAASVATPSSQLSQASSHGPADYSDYGSLLQDRGRPDSRSASWMSVFTASVVPTLRGKALTPTGIPAGPILDGSKDFLVILPLNPVIGSDLCHPRGNGARFLSNALQQDATSSYGPKFAKPCRADVVIDESFLRCIREVPVTISRQGLTFEQLREGSTVAMLFKLSGLLDSHLRFPPHGMTTVEAQKSLWAIIWLYLRNFTDKDYGLLELGTLNSAGGVYRPVILEGLLALSEMLEENDIQYWWDESPSHSRRGIITIVGAVADIFHLASTILEATKAGHCGRLLPFDTHDRPLVNCDTFTIIPRVLPAGRSNPAVDIISQLSVVLEGVRASFPTARGLSDNIRDPDPRLFSDYQDPSLGSGPSNNGHSSGRGTSNGSGRSSGGQDGGSSSGIGKGDSGSGGTLSKAPPPMLRRPRLSPASSAVCPSVEVIAPPSVAVDPTSSMSPSAPSPGQSFLPLIQMVALVLPYLSQVDIAALACTASAFRIVSNRKEAMLFCDAPRTLTLETFVQRRRVSGFGRPSPSHRSVTNDVLSGYSIIHHLWEFISPQERRFLACEVDTDGILLEYASLRAQIPHLDLLCLRKSRVVEPLASMSVESRSQLLGAALISLNFNVGNLMRCLGPEFRHGFRNVEHEMQYIEDLNLPDPPPGYPPVDLPMAREILQDGVPLVGHFHCPLAATHRRIRYNNHPPLKEAESDVREKFLKEEQKCFHLLLPRFLAYFIFGLFISPISWVLRRGKGRIVIDSSTPMTAGDMSAPNAQIAKPSAENYRENPPVHYASAWIRFLVHIFQLRTNWPAEEILLHVDDIEAAFRRVLYHPDLAAVFASVFMEWLVIPVGMIFGSRSSPSFYCILAELRSHVASVAQLDDIPVPEEWQVSLPPDISDSERESLAAVGTDPLYVLPSPASDGPLQQAAFVDDSGKAELRRRILEAVRNSVAAAFLVFGFPDNDWRGACFAVDKWLSEACHEAVYLGFLVNTRSMTVSWPIPRRIELTELITGTLPKSTSDRRKRQPVHFAKILGKLRNPATLAPALTSLSLRIQYWFNGAIRASKGKSMDSRWWFRPQLSVPNNIWNDLRLLLRVADSTDPSDPFWHRPIGLLIPRTTTHFAYQDASYEGLGGFSFEFGFAWRLHRDELIAAGIHLPSVTTDASAPFPADCHLLFQPASDDAADPTSLTASATHINILEFIAAIINYWFILWRANHLQEPEGGWIVAILGEDHRVAYRGSFEYDSGPPVETVDRSTLVGIRYRATPRAAEIPGLSSTTAATLDNFQARVISKPRGGAREGNDHTLDSRAHYFANWLAQKVPQSDVPILLENGLFPALIATYLGYVIESGGLRRKENLDAGTIAGYAKAAELYIQTMFDSSFHARALNGENFVPVISDIIAHHRSWGHSERTNKEPITWKIFQVLWDNACSTEDPVGVEGAVFDILGIGVSTASRLAEYGQSKVPKGLLFSVVPDGVDAGKSLAFTRADFVFHDGNGIRRDHQSFLHDPDVDFSSWSMTILFRYDKSPRNYVRKTYKAIPGCILCPLSRAISILRRADIMHLPATYPVGAYWDYQKSRAVFLTGKPITDLLRAACIQAYPDEKHYMREHIEGLVPHSVRVTAAVALKAAGLDHYNIAQRLRWEPESVATYLRECYQDIGALTRSAVYGAFQINPNDPSAR